jgi:two-component system cell cycle sensor histidine kinase/response regulator CckA
MSGNAPPEAGPERGPLEREAVGVVLVVDDEAIVRTWIGRVLEQEGIPCFLAADGREAVRLVADGRVRPVVLLTDIEMPSMGGVELAARMLALRPGLRVVMMTGDPAHAENARDRSSIVATVLTKPIRMTELVAAVRPDAMPARS